MFINYHLTIELGSLTIESVNRYPIFIKPAERVQFVVLSMVIYSKKNNLIAW